MPGPCGQGGGRQVRLPGRLIVQPPEGQDGPQRAVLEAGAFGLKALASFLCFFFFF